MIQFYGYDKCSTCRKAKKWLDERGVAYRFIDITQQPPTAATLRGILQAGGYELRHLFNTSGQLYRQMDIKSKLPGMSQAEALALLAKHGKLVKRPIVTDGRSRHTVGFDEDQFRRVWG